VTRRAAALLGLALAGLLAAAPAGAHEVDPTVLFVVDDAPDIDGITLEVATSVTTQLLLENSTQRPIEVLSDEGQPFLRVGPDGVEANLAAPDWYLTNQPFAGGRVPAEATPDAPARWAVVSEATAWGWFDHRLHPTAVTADLGEPREHRFVVPLRYGDDDLELRGHLERRTTVPRFASALTAVPEATTGLAVQLLQGRAPGLFARYDGPGEAVVLGRDGEPFLRLGPEGALVNRRSPTWLFNAQARGEDLAGVGVDPAAAPEWAVVGGGASYAWLDPRALIEEIGDEPVTLDWTIPITVGDGTVEVTGRSTAELIPLAAVAGPADDGGPGGGLVLVIALVVVTLGAVGWLARGWIRTTGRG
jgi:hypothetical protein